MENEEDATTESVKPEPAEDIFQRLCPAWPQLASSMHHRLMRLNACLCRLSAQKFVSLAARDGRSSLQMEHMENYNGPTSSKASRGSEAYARPMWILPPFLHTLKTIAYRIPVSHYIT